MNKKFIFTIILSLCTIYLSAQSVEGYDFTKYAAKLNTKSKKASLKLSSNPSALKYADYIKDYYEHSAIGFAGNYVPVMKNNGDAGFIGFIVDIRDGKVYNLPINKSNTSNNCIDEENIFDKYLFLADSRLLVTSTCDIKEDASAKKKSIIQAFYIYTWNEATKKFTLIKKINKSTPKP